MQLPPDAANDHLPGTTTGRSLVLFAEGAARAGAEALVAATGARTVALSEDVTQPAPNEMLLFEQLGVAVVGTSPQQMLQAGVMATGADGIVAVEPERINHALGTTAHAARSPRSPEYLRGFRDAVLHLTSPTGDGLVGDASHVTPPDESQATWGIQAVMAVQSALSGKGIRVAVLDTGCDLDHPDLQGREITSQSFVAGEAVQDANGHGTHCIGTSMGPKRPPSGPRYGVAYDAEIFAGKVLSNAGSGSDAQILGGIEWAVQHGCAIVSMSLGAATRPGQPFSQVFEAVAERAQRAGTLIIAAAGNESNRPISVSPVGHPANCPSIMAVAAIDANIMVAPFSNRGLSPGAGQIDVAGPGVDVLSSYPMPARYRRLSGTSMATPHAAGVAALLAEANPDARGAALGQLLTTRARRLEHLSSADVGAGLVQAP
jgi:subtilisin family serine protease